MACIYTGTTSSCGRKPIAGVRCSRIYTSVARILLTAETRANYKRFRLGFEKADPAVCVKCYIYYDWQYVMKK
jgi:hypothetical protein